MRSDPCYQCGHSRGDHHYQPGGGCCAEVDRYERCSCPRFKPDPQNDPRKGERRKRHRSRFPTLWVNRERTVLMRTWTENGRRIMEIATRSDPNEVWGPPVRVEPEKSS